MSQSVLEKDVCEECGVDIREYTYYCYNCGTKIPKATSTRDAIEKANSGFRDIELDPVEQSLGSMGGRSVENISAGGKQALDELAERMKIDDKPPDADAIARAAAKRKLSRNAKRKGNEYVWEPVNDPPGRQLLILVCFIVLLSTLAVVMTVIWK